MAAAEFDLVGRYPADVTPGASTPVVRPRAPEAETTTATAKPGSNVGLALALVVGSAWAFHSMLQFARPNYVQPLNLLDWYSVVAFSVALALLAVECGPPSAAR